MKNALFESTKKELSRQPKQLIDLNQWLFLTINTAKSMIDNADKSQFFYLKSLLTAIQLEIFSNYLIKYKGNLEIRIFRNAIALNTYIFVL